MLQIVHENEKRRLANRHYDLNFRKIAGSRVSEYPDLNNGAHKRTCAIKNARINIAHVWIGRAGNGKKQTAIYSDIFTLPLMIMKLSFNGKD